MSYPETDREQPGTKISPASGTARVSRFQCPKIFAVVLVFLILCFAKPLYGLVRYAWHSDLYSHILLIPFVSGYLVWSKKKNLASQSRGGRSFALFPLLAGLGILLGYWLGIGAGWYPRTADYLAVMMSSFVLLLIAGTMMLIGTEALRRVAFPAALLIFIIPFPTAVLGWIEGFLQHGSAECAYLLFKLSGMPVLREGMFMHLPAFSLEVAPECSGIHSTLVLFITSFVAGHLLLGRTWTKAALVLAVVPLALLRNGLRIFTIGQLCVRVSPDMINSYIHRQGGPIFFAASLVPFLLLLLLLRKVEGGILNHGRTPNETRSP